MFSIFRTKIPSRVFKTGFCVSGRPIRGKIFLEKVCILVFSGLRARSFGHLRRVYSAKISNRLFACRVYCENFWGGLSKLDSSCPKDLIGMFCDLCTNFFWTLIENFLVVWQSFLAGLPKLPSSSPHEIWIEKKNKFKWKKIALPFLTLSCWFSGLWQKKIMGHQNCFRRVEKNFSAKMLLRKNLFFIPLGCQQTLLGLLAGKFWHNCNPSFYVTGRKFWWKKIRGNVNSNLFSILGEKLQKFPRRLSAEPSELHSTYPEDELLVRRVWAEQVGGGGTHVLR